jgi:RND family efflux transporter MFP subunit
MSGVWASGWAVLLLAALVGSGCDRSQATSTTATPPAALPTVAVAKVAAETITRELLLTGEFRPYQSIELHAKVAGYLKAIEVDVGDRVRAGQLVATLEIPEIAPDLTHAAAGIRRAASELTRLGGELERAEANRALVDLSHSRLLAAAKTEPGLIAQQELDDVAARKRVAAATVAAATAAIASAEQQVEAARATEQRIQAMADYTRIVAPFAGLITRRYADPGAMIQAGTASQTQAMPVVRLAQIDRLRLAVPVPESAAPRIRVGSPVRIRVQSLGSSLEGRVARVTKTVELDTRTMTAEIDVPNPDGRLFPGLYAEVVLTLEKRDSALTVPVQAISGHDTHRSVTVVGPDGTLQERTIQVGLETAASVEVVDGLAADELVVVGNRSQLQAGQKVQPKLMSID